MKSNVFFLKSLIFPLLICISFVGINYYVDIYGIFGWENNPEKVVYGEERIAKYLKAHEYIPRNFDGLLLGPSLSSNIDPAGFTVANVYNASVIGGHVTSMFTLYEKASANGGNFKTILVCINPFVTSNHEGENLNMKPADYWAAWGSYNLLKYYLLVVIRNLNLFPGKFPENQHTSNGANYFEYRFKVQDVEARILEYAESITEKDFIVHEVAKKELLALSELLCASNSKVVVYHHPLPEVVYVKHRQSFDNYWKKINLIMKCESNGFVSVDFNRPEYLSFTSDSENYMDHWHLSTLGQKKFVELMNNYLISSNNYNK